MPFQDYTLIQAPMAGGINATMMRILRDFPQYVLMVLMNFHEASDEFEHRGRVSSGRRLTRRGRLRIA